MEAQAAHNKQPVPAVATLPGRSTLTCATCGGTGERGSTQTFKPMSADEVLVLNQTHWCPTCKGLGEVFEP